MSPRPWWEARIEELEREVLELRSKVEAAQEFRAAVERFRAFQEEPGEPVNPEGIAPRILWVDPRHRAAFEELGIEVPE